MNERVADSSGLPLRAMVMVLLFFGVIFLLLGWQALGSSGSSGDDPLPVSSTTKTVAPSAAPSSPPAPPPPAEQAVVRVYNISEKEGVAARTADQLTQDGFKVTDIGNLALPDIAGTTVFYGDTAGERATAEAVGQKLRAPVEPRIPDLADQPPGVIVVVSD